MSPSTTVYVVEADDAVRRATQRLLRAARFQVVCTSNLDDRLALDLPDTDAVIVADLGTTRQYAETLPHQLHAENQPLPVIYLTDYDTDQIRNEAKRAGAAGYFRKPVDELALVDAISFAAGQSATREAS